MGQSGQLFVAKWLALWECGVLSADVRSTAMVFRVSPPGMISLGWDSAVRAKGRGSAASDETERQLPRTGAAIGCEVSRIGRSTVTIAAPDQMNHPERGSLQYDIMRKREKRIC